MATTALPIVERDPLDELLWFAFSVLAAEAAWAAFYFFYLWPRSFEMGGQLLIVGLIWILNLAISYFNARGVGLAWVETKHAGGWRRFMVWMGAIMAACGFTWCFLLVLAGGAAVMHWITPPAFVACMGLGYLIIVPAVLFSGLMITIDSWAIAYRTRRLSDIGGAGYNTFAQAYNTYNAVSDYGTVLRDVFGFFTGGDKKASDDDDGQEALIVIALVAVALIGGIIITAAIIKRYAGTGQLQYLGESWAG